TGLASVIIRGGVVAMPVRPMQRLTRFLTFSSLVLLGLSACSLEPRQGPPAPIVQATPRAGRPARPSAPPRPEPVPKQPSESISPGTQVYAYRDPSAAPESSAPPATGDQPASPLIPNAPPPGEAPQGVTQTPGTPPASGLQTALTDSQASDSSDEPPPDPARRLPEQVVAKVDRRLTLPAAETPSGERPVTPALALPPSNFAVPTTLSPAAAKLVAQAEQQRQAGDFAAAAALLERSLRIAPREAYLWNRLARVRLEQGQVAQAGNLAARANDLAGNQEDIKRDNWRIIAESRRRLGDLAAASEAERRASGQ
ncbi:MAG: tetratricopeptide repeat protein, partial [Thermochromatium sp.]